MQLQYRDEGAHKITSVEHSHSMMIFDILANNVSTYQNSCTNIYRDHKEAIEVGENIPVDGEEVGENIPVDGEDCAGDIVITDRQEGCLSIMKQ